MRDLPGLGYSSYPGPLLSGQTIKFHQLASPVNEDFTQLCGVVGRVYELSL